MKKLNVKRLRNGLLILAVIFAMNTGVFAATSSNSYNVSISGITRNEYSYSLGYTKVSANATNPAVLDELTGASTSLGVRFSVKVEGASNTNYYTNSRTYSEGQTTLELTYNSVNITGPFRIKVIQVDYPRVTSATLTTVFTP